MYCNAAMPDGLTFLFLRHSLHYGENNSISLSLFTLAEYYELWLCSKAGDLSSHSSVHPQIKYFSVLALGAGCQWEEIL